LLYSFHFFGQVLNARMRETRMNEFYQKRAGNGGGGDDTGI